MEAQGPVSSASNKSKSSIWFIIGGVVLACCCGAVAIGGVAGLFLYTSSSTTTSSPPITSTGITPQVEWLVTADELNTFSNDVGIVQWELGNETPGQYRVCRDFSGVSWSASPNQAVNCIYQSAGGSLDEAVDSFFQSGQLYSDEAPIEASFNFDGQYALYAGTTESGHGIYDLFLLQNGLVYWSSVSLGRPAGVSAVELYQSDPQVIQGFLENMIRINLQRSQ